MRRCSWCGFDAAFDHCPGTMEIRPCTMVEVLPSKETRALLTRALTAQAWAYSCSFLMPSGDYYRSLDCERQAALPSPAELAAEILGP